MKKEYLRHTSKTEKSSWESVKRWSLIIQAFATVGPPTKVSNNLSSRLAETGPLIEYIHAISPLISASSLISLTVIGKDPTKIASISEPRYSVLRTLLRRQGIDIKDHQRKTICVELHNLMFQNRPDSLKSRN